LLTSRAEYRLVLRHDNADLRLTDKGYELGLIDEAREQAFTKKKETISQEIERLRSTRIKPSEKVNALLEELHQSPLKDGVLASEFLKRPNVTYLDVMNLLGETIAPDIDRYVREQIEISLRYEGYIKKEQIKIDRLHRMEAKKIPAQIDYDAINGLATEARQKFNKIRP